MIYIRNMCFFRYMDAQTLSSSEHELGLSFKQSDIATLYIVQHELLQSSDVEFAGVIVKHPLTNECWMRITSKSNPRENLADAANTAVRIIDEMRDALNTDIRIS